MRDNKLTWLHISDIHFHPQRQWRDSISRTALLTHLTSIFAQDESLRPDFIFCTGDIAFGESSQTSLSEQYSQAREFFGDLLAVCSDRSSPLAKERIFVVPGNHDVARSSINSDAQTTLNSFGKSSTAHASSINQRFNDCSIEFKEAIKRLDEYGAFVKEYLPHQQDDNGRHQYAKIVSVKGFKVGVAGFNSSWTCAGPEDDRNIWLAAEWQFNAARQALRHADIRIGLIHHPLDWFNLTDREVATRRLATDYHFWLHGHSHDAWVTPIQSHIVIAAGAIGAEDTREFGVNLTSIDLRSLKGITHLHTKRSGSNGWTIAPIENHAPMGVWRFELPTTLKEHLASTLAVSDKAGIRSQAKVDSLRPLDFVDRILTQRLESALQCLPSQPRVWITPSLYERSELSPDARTLPRIDPSNLVDDPRSCLIKAPPQYGLTCLAHFLTRAAWRSPSKSFWLYLNSAELRPGGTSIDEAVSSSLNPLGLEEEAIKCVILDSWSSNDKNASRLLTKVSTRFSDIPIICMERMDVGMFRQTDSRELPRPLEVLYLWSLPRDGVRKIVAAYNAERYVGDEDAVTTRLVSDLDVLNLHRTPLNCLTLLKVSEVDFDESPVNRSELIKRVLFLVFNTDIPTYKSRPDLKDCEYVLGHFCEILIKDGSHLFARDKFLLETRRFCEASLIDLETELLFDIIVANNILVKRGTFFSFKFAYWIFYFVAQRMHHEPQFASYIFEGMRYAQYPEIIEFYTAIDRKREDAISLLIRDVRACKESVRDNSGLPEGFNPYAQARWNLSPEHELEMHEIIAEGVKESSLPAGIKDEFADRNYDKARPYNQDIANLLTEHSFSTMMQTMKAGSRALRNSDYVSPNLKRELLGEIMGCWEQATKILLVVLPVLAAEQRALYDGTSFYLSSGFGTTPQERFIQIFSAIPYNVVSWCQDDLFSQKMGRLLVDQLQSKALSSIARHELMLMLVRQRPRNWDRQVHAYIAASDRNSFHLFDICDLLRHEYRYGFASPQVLKDMEHLIKMAATKQITGHKEPGVKAIKKVKFRDGFIPSRDA